LVKPMERISSMYGLLALEVSDEVYKAEPAAISMLSTLLDVDVVLGHLLLLPLLKEAQSVPLHVRTSDGLVGRPRSRMVTRTRYLAAATRGEEAAVEAAHKVLAAIRERFPPVPVMDSLELI
jgi:hypothetical protein